MPCAAQVVASEWNHFSGNWNVAANWNPADVPDNGGGFTYDVQIGNLPVATNAQITFVPEDGATDTITSLSLSSGVDFFTNGNQLSMTGLTTVSGANTTLRLEPHATPSVDALTSLNLNLVSGGFLVAQGGSASITSQLQILSGSNLLGYGTINLGDSDAVVEQAFDNSALIQVQGTTQIPATLTLHTNGVDTIDLDGDNELGVVDVSNASSDLEFDTLHLIVDGPLADPFGSTAPGAELQIGQRDTITFNDDFAIAANAKVIMDGGTDVATINGPAAITDIQGAAFTIAGAAEIDNNMSFTGTANTITLAAAGSLRLNGNVDIADASAISLTSTSELIVGGDVVISEAAGDFNWDGPGIATTTIDGSGQLSFFVNRIDTSDDIYGGNLNLQANGDLLVDNVANFWTMAGVLTKSGFGTSLVAGDAMSVTGTINVNAGLLDLPTATLTSAAHVTTNAELRLGPASVLAGPNTLTGTGLLRMEGTSTISANTTLNVANFDWDGLGSGTTQTINDGVAFTINSTLWDPDDAGDVDDNINLGGNGAQLIVNGIPTWTMARTINANTAALGTATIGGSAVLLLEGPSAAMNVDGNTNVTGPITFGTTSFTSIDAGMILDLGSTATFKGGTITGAGNFKPANSNLVTASSSINSTNFDFDSGNWTIQDGSLLTVNVGDYDPDVPDNAFNGIINLNNSDISVNTGDAEFIMDRILSMSSTEVGEVTQWSGEPLDIGNDANTLSAALNVTGTQISRISSQVDFNSDADVDIAAGATLDLTGTVNFDTVNGLDKAEFTGGGTLDFSGAVNVNEATTINMAGGGIVDFDGIDVVGDTINVDAPLTINAATMSSFGKNNASGTNVLEIDNAVGTGKLTVTLDSATREWTINPAGTLALINDNTSAVLLTGNDVNLNGSTNVTGEVEVTARVDIGGTVNLNTAAEPLHLSGGLLDTDPNMILGGTINGPGVLNAPTNRELRGFGTINAAIDFDGLASLRADDGMLTINGSIDDVSTIGTANASGFLNVVNAWNSSVATGVVLAGGELKGGAITVANAGGIRGLGLVSSRVFNNTRLQGDVGTLVVKTAANDNDWDGTGNTGQLTASNGGTLEVNDNATFNFGGTVIADHGRVYAKGFGMNFGATSTVSLLAGTFEADESTAFNGAIAAGAGGPSTLKVQVNRFMTLAATSHTTLASDLKLQSNNIELKAGATITGPGAVIVDTGSHMVTDNLAQIDTLLDLRGDLSPGGFEIIGRLNVQDFQQGPDSTLHIELTGTSLNQFDRVVVNGAAILAGRLEIDIDGGFVPVAGQTFDILSAPAGISGQFNGVELSGLPADLVPVVSYPPGVARITMVSGTLYDLWIQSFAALTNPADRLKTADPDHDGFDNLTEFALNGNPTQAKGIDKQYPKIAPVGAENAFTLTVPIRIQAGPVDYTPGVDLLDDSATFRYAIVASDDLQSFPLTVTEVTGANADAIQAGLPLPDPGWELRTFRSPGPVEGDPKEFMRVLVVPFP